MLGRDKQYVHPADPVFVPNSGWHTQKSNYFVTLIIAVQKTMIV